jgi:hypothetical protein
MFLKAETGTPSLVRASRGWKIGHSPQPPLPRNSGALSLWSRACARSSGSGDKPPLPVGRVDARRRRRRRPVPDCSLLKVAALPGTPTLPLSRLRWLDGRLQPSRSNPVKRPSSDSFRIGGSQAVEWVGGEQVIEQYPLNPSMGIDSKRGRAFRYLTNPGLREQTSC